MEKLLLILSKFMLSHRFSKREDFLVKQHILFLADCVNVDEILSGRISSFWGRCVSFISRVSLRYSLHFSVMHLNNPSFFRITQMIHGKLNSHSDNLSNPSA